jgi:hypothetical protein
MVILRQILANEQKRRQGKELKSKQGMYGGEN